MDLTLEDDDSRRTVAVGEEICVQLPETPTTGYLWRAEVDGEALELLTDSYDVAEHPRGAAGWHTFTFRARRRGPAALVLVQGRPWEGGHSAEYRVELDVRD